MQVDRPMQALTWWLLETDLFKNNIVLYATMRAFVRTLLRKSAGLPSCALSDIIRILTARAARSSEACASERYTFVLEIKHKPHCGRCVGQQRVTKVTRRRPLSELEQLRAAASM